MFWFTCKYVENSVHAEPDVLKADDVPQLKWQPADEEGLVTFLVGEKNFNEDRVRKQIQKMAATKGKSAQGIPFACKCHVVGFYCEAASSFFAMSNTLPVLHVVWDCVRRVTYTWMLVCNVPITAPLQQACLHEADVAASVHGLTQSSRPASLALLPF